MRQIIGILSMIMIGSATTAFAQSPFIDKLKDFKLEPFVMLQLWGTYSNGQELYNPELGDFEEVDNRFNVQLRRARLGFRGQPYERLKFTFIGAYDLVGRDVLSGTVGGVNPPSPDFIIWDAFVQWKISANTDHIHLTGGFFRPQFSRESITSGWSTNSFEKSMSQNYIRRHLVGTGPGRSVGLNLGGLIVGENKVGLQYNVGIFNPLLSGDPQQSSFGNTVGKNYAPLLVGRAVLQLGDPEQNTYKIGYDINYYSKRRGLSLGWAGSYQGETDLFTQSTALGVDFLFNWDNLNLDGDFNFMFRSGERPLDGGIRSFDYNSQTGHIRAGWNVLLGEKLFLEPTFMIMRFEGADDLTAQADADAVNSFSGSETTYDLGVNWYINKKHLKLALHYTWREGDAGDAGDVSRVNQFFSQSNAGAIRRGDFVGLGLFVIL